MYVDHGAANLADFVCGANERDVHYTGVNWVRDLPEPKSQDIRNVQKGDPSPSGRGVLTLHAASRSVIYFSSDIVLTSMARLFWHVEAIAFNAPNANVEDHAVRIGITTKHSAELEYVIRVSPTELPYMESVQKSILPSTWRCRVERPRGDHCSRPNQHRPATAQQIGRNHKWQLGNPQSNVHRLSNPRPPATSCPCQVARIAPHLRST